MKKYLILFLISPFLWSQNVMNTIAEETCACGKKIDFTNTSSAEIEMSFGFCILESFSNHKAAVEKHYGKPMEITDDSFEKFAEDVGIQMVGVCPELFIKMAGNDDMLDMMLEEEETEERFTASGKVHKIEKSQFLILHLNNDQNSLMKFIFLYDATNSSMLRDDGFLKDKNITVEYSKMEFYDPKIDDFRVFNVIDGITLQ